MKVYKDFQQLLTIGSHLSVSDIQHDIYASSMMVKFQQTQIYLFRFAVNHRDSLFGNSKAKKEIDEKWAMVNTQDAILILPPPSSVCLYLCSLARAIQKATSLQVTSIHHCEDVTRVQISCHSVQLTSPINYHSSS